MFRDLFLSLFPRDINIPRKLLDSVRELEAVIKYRFKKRSTLIQALKHRSYVSAVGENRNDSNERLEFLGDSVLNFVVGKYFYGHFENKNEGDLTKIRSVIVSGENLCKSARKLGLGKYILISEYEEKTGGRDKDSLLEDCMEALIGAVYIDGGIEKAEELIMNTVLNENDADDWSKLKANAKSELLELVQSNGFHPPTYETVSEEGPEHEKTFTVNVLINDKIVADGSSWTKKKAEQNASSKALEIIRGDKYFFKRFHVSKDQDDK